MLPPLHYQGLDSAQPFGYQPPPPARVPALSAPAVPPPGLVGTVRPADQMEGDGEDVPPTKRQRVAKLPGGQYYPEQDWINMHPVRIYLFSMLGRMRTDGRAWAALDLTPSPVADGHQQARVEDGWYNCDDPRTATQFVGINAARPHHRDDGQRAVRWAAHSFVQWKNAHESQYHRELQSRGGRSACPERAGPEEEVACRRAVPRVRVCACKYCLRLVLFRYEIMHIILSPLLAYVSIVVQVLNAHSAHPSSGVYILNCFAISHSFLGRSDAPLCGSTNYQHFAT